MIRLYDIPDNTFDSENEDADDEEGGMWTPSLVFFSQYSQSRFNNIVKSPQDNHFCKQFV